MPLTTVTRSFIHLGTEKCPQCGDMNAIESLFPADHPFAVEVNKRHHIADAWAVISTAGLEKDIIGQGVGCKCGHCKPGKFFAGDRS